MNSTYISNGAKLFFSETGAGLPVIFLHPTPLNHDFWHPLIEQVAGIRAIAPDLRGHGTSELGSSLPVGGFARVPDAPVLTMAQLAADTLALMDHLAIPEALFAGCSIGGYALLELWRQAPQRVRALTFMCSKPQPDAEGNLAKRVANIAQARAGAPGAIDAFFDNAAQSLVGATTRQSHPEVVCELRAQMTITSDVLVAVQAGLAARPDSLPTVATIGVPVLAIAGSEDATVSPNEVEAFRAAPGGCEFHLLPGIGHFAAYEEPQKVAALLASWLRNSKFLPSSNH